jgi:hypothetical protein
MPNRRKRHGSSDPRLQIADYRIGDSTEPHRFTSPCPSMDDGGHETIHVHVHSFRSGTLGDVTGGGAAPVHPSSSRARSRRGTPPAGPLDTYDSTRPKWRKYIHTP